MSSTWATKSQLIYLLSYPGLLRSFNVCLGLVSIILTYIGFENDMPILDRDPFYSNVMHKTPYLTYYGLGYKEEGINKWSFGIICLSFLISVIFLLVLFFVKEAEVKLKAWNRFLNLALSMLLSLGWITGLVCANKGTWPLRQVGFLMFRQGCCRVEILSNERISHPSEGYTTDPCLCTIWPHNDPEVPYPVLLPQDSPLGIRFQRADPHHFYGHVIALMYFYGVILLQILVLINVITYFGAFIFV